MFLAGHCSLGLAKGSPGILLLWCKKHSNQGNPKGAEENGGWKGLQQPSDPALLQYRKECAPLKSRAGELSPDVMASKLGSWDVSPGPPTESSDLLATGSQWLFQTFLL